MPSDVKERVFYLVKYFTFFRVFFMLFCERFVFSLSLVALLSFLVFLSPPESKLLY
jgi:hypothetical protein